LSHQCVLYARVLRHALEKKKPLLVLPAQDALNLVSNAKKFPIIIAMPLTLAIILEATMNSGLFLAIAIAIAFYLNLFYQAFPPLECK
jgi:hypothetical protein